MSHPEDESTLPLIPAEGVPPQNAETRRLDSFIGQDTVDHVPAKASGLHVRCPHCHYPIELLPDSELVAISCSSCGISFSLTTEDDPTRDKRGVTQIGHFKLIESLGSGGFGTVWKAYDEKLDRTVAVKIPRSGNLDKFHQDLFLREARSAAQLSHPNIVPVFEVGRDGERLYIVSELVRGVALSDRITAGPLTAREAVEICAKVADALQHAHEQGVVHRDLKPANVMLDANGEPRLMDFGLARREANEITMTVEGQVLGTPAYMSPEQAQGEGHTADRRSDIYSLGAMLFQLLTGELPFRGNTRMLIHQVIHDEPPSPRKLNGAVPRDLETITLKCMEKDPNRRFPTASDLAAEFRRYLAGEPIQARPISKLERGWRWCRRKPVVAGLAAAVLVTTISGGAVSGYFAIEASARAEQAIAEKKRADQKAEEALATAEREKRANREAAEQRDKALALTRRTSLQSLEQVVSKAELLWTSGAQNKAEALKAIREGAAVSRAIGALVADDSSGESPEMAEFRRELTGRGARLERIAARWLTCAALVEGPPVRVPQFESGYGEAPPIVSSPDGSRLAVVSGRSQEVQIMDMEGKLLARIPVGPLIYQAAELLTFADSSRVRLPDGRGEVLEYEIPAEPSEAPLEPSKREREGQQTLRRSERGFQFNGRIASEFFVAAGRGGRIYCQAKSGKPPGATLLWQGDGDDAVSDMCFSGSGKQLFFVSSQSVGAIDIESGICSTVPRVGGGDRYDPMDRTARLVLVGSGFMLVDAESARRGSGDGFVSLPTWQPLWPEAPVVQLNAGKKITGMGAFGGGVCLGFEDGSVSVRNATLRPAWQTSPGFDERFGQRRGESDTWFSIFYSPLELAGAEGKALVLRPQLMADDAEHLRVFRTSDGEELSAEAPQGVQYVNTAADNRFIVYERSTGGKRGTVLYDVVQQKLVKDFDGEALNVDRSGSGPRRILAVTSESKNTLQFWKLPELTLLGELPFGGNAEESSDSTRELDDVILLDRDETYAVVFLQGRSEDGMNVLENPAAYGNVAIVQLEPFLSTPVPGGLRLPSALVDDISLEKSGDHLIARTGSYTEGGLLILNAKSANVKTIENAGSDTLVSKTLPRVLIEREGADHGTTGRELFDLDLMKSLRYYEGMISVGPLHSSTHYLLRDGDETKAHRWDNGEEDPALGSGIRFVTDEWQLRRAEDGARLKLAGREEVALRGFRVQDAENRMPWLSDNCATLFWGSSLWDATTGERIVKWKGRDCLDLNESQQRMLLRVRDGGASRLRTYDLSTGKVISEAAFDGFPAENKGSFQYWSPAANRLVFWTSEGVDLVDSSTGKLLRSISYGTHLEPVKAFATTAESPVVLSRSDGLAIAWQKRSGKFEREIHHSASPMRDMELSGDGRQVMTLTENGSLALAELSGEQRWKRESLGPSRVVFARFTSTGQVLAACEDGALSKLSAADGSTIAELQLTSGAKFLTMSPSRRYVFVVTDANELLRVEVESFMATKSVPLDGAPTAICALSDVVCCVGGDQIDAWSLDDGKRTWSIDVSDAATLMMAYQAGEGRLIAVDEKGQGCAIRLNDLAAAFENLGLPRLTAIGDP